MKKQSSRFKEPFISIEGILYDVQVGIMSIPQATKEIKKYFLAFPSYEI